MRIESTHIQLAELIFGTEIGYFGYGDFLWRQGDPCNQANRKQDSPGTSFIVVQRNLFWSPYLLKPKNSSNAKTTHKEFRKRETSKTSDRCESLVRGVCVCAEAAAFPIDRTDLKT